MTTVVFDQPYPLVSLEEAKVGLGEDADDRNALITGMIMAAQSELDGPSGWLGLCIAVQGIEHTVDNFSSTITLPFGPVIEPVEIYYIDGEGAEQIVDSTSYRVLASGKIVLASSATWPIVSEQEAAVRIRYYAGIEDSFDPRINLLKTAIILHVRMTMDGVDSASSRRAIESLVRSLWVPTC